VPAVFVRPEFWKFHQQYHGKDIKQVVVVGGVAAYWAHAYCVLGPCNPYMALWARVSVFRSVEGSRCCVVGNNYWCWWNCSRSALFVSAALCTNVPAGSNMFYNKGSNISGTREICVWCVWNWEIACVADFVEWIWFKNVLKITISIVW
jgi:hypothetical protein